MVSLSFYIHSFASRRRNVTVYFCTCPSHLIQDSAKQITVPIHRILQSLILWSNSANIQCLLLWWLCNCNKEQMNRANCSYKKMPPMYHPEFQLFCLKSFSYPCPPFSQICSETIYKSSLLSQYIISKVNFNAHCRK